MQPKVLLFVALLAPHTAAAFGDLDCISIESCGNGGCGPASDVFSVNFDWLEDAATVVINNASSTLPLNTRGEDEATVVSEYGDLDGDQASALRIEATGGDITAYLTTKNPMATTLVAQCDVRQDA